MKKSQNSTVNNLIRTEAKNMYRHFTEKVIWIANKHMKRSATSLAIKKVQVTMKYHYMPNRMAKMENSDNKRWQRRRKARSLM